MALAISVGLLIGVATNNIGLWIALGAAVGAAIETSKRNKH